MTCLAMLNWLEISIEEGKEGQLREMGTQIPDGSGGIFASWGVQAGSTFVNHISHITSAGVTDSTPSFQNGISSMVLGENSTLFATDAVSVTSFSSSLSSNWTYVAPSGINCLAALQTGELVLADSSPSQLLISATGSPTLSIGGVDGCCPRSLGFWHTISNGRSAVAAGPSTVLSNIWPLMQGGRPATRTSQTLIYAEFIPTSPGSPGDLRFGSMELAKDDIQKNLKAPNINSIPFWDEGATVDEFKSILAKPIAAVAFIGHAFEFQPSSGPKYSVGLFLKHLALIKRGIVPNVDPATTVETDKIHTEATVIFIASCEVGPVFLSLWDIDDSTPSRALVVPDQVAMAAWQSQNHTNFDLGDVDLVQGTIAWEALAKALASGSKLNAAVAAANTAAAQFYAGIPVADRKSALAIWKPIGGSSGANICLTTCQ